MDERRLWETNQHPQSYLRRDRLSGRKVSPFTKKVQGSKASQREVEADPGRYFPQWFNPGRECPLPSYCSRQEYERMRASLKDLNRNLDLTWHPIREVWQVYTRSDRITMWWTKGWYRVVMMEPQPNLMEKLKARLYQMHPTVFGKAKVHADRILYEDELDLQRFDALLDDDARAHARELYWKQLPKNIGKGDMVARQYE